jgi:hypothetical protein
MTIHLEGATSTFAKASTRQACRAGIAAQPELRPPGKGFPKSAQPAVDPPLPAMTNGTATRFCAWFGRRGIVMSWR